MTAVSDRPERASGRRIVCALAAVLLGLCMASAAHADFAAGERAYSRGEYRRAIAEFRPLLERGHAGAELMTGLMYLQGDGYTRDPTVAALWLFKAASKGEHSAQLVLGSQRLYGHGLDRDLVDAYMWLTLARGSDRPSVVAQAAVFLDDAETLMTREQIERALARARSWEPVHDGFADDD